MNYCFTTQYHNEHGQWNCNLLACSWERMRRQISPPEPDVASLSNNLNKSNKCEYETHTQTPKDSVSPSTKHIPQIAESTFRATFFELFDLLVSFGWIYVTPLEVVRLGPSQPSRTTRHLPSLCNPSNISEGFRGRLDPQNPPGSRGTRKAPRALSSQYPCNLDPESSVRAQVNACSPRCGGPPPDHPNKSWV